MGHVLNLELPFGPCVNEVLSLNLPSIIKLHKRAGLSLPELELERLTLDQSYGFCSSPWWNRRKLLRACKPEDDGTMNG